MFVFSQADFYPNWLVNNIFVIGIYYIIFVIVQDV